MTLTQKLESISRHVAWTVCVEQGRYERRGDQFTITNPKWRVFDDAGREHPHLPPDGDCPVCAERFK
jgi:hypothetical protein